MFPLADDARIKFKQYVNVLATTKTEGDEKFLILKPKYSQSGREEPLQRSPQKDPRNSIGIPISPAVSVSDFSPYASPVPRLPPPYRPPPPVTSPSSSLDNISVSSFNLSSNEGCITPQAPPRRKSSDKVSQLSVHNPITPDKQSSGEEKENEPLENGEKQTISVKERTQKFNRLASVEDDLSPRQIKEKKKTQDKNVSFLNS